MKHERSLNEQTGSNRRGKFIGFWAKEDLYEQVKRDADTAGLTVSDYLRELSSGEPVPRKQRAPHAARIEVGKFIGHLGKIGSNLNQIAHQANRAALAGKWEAMPTAEEIVACCTDLQSLLQDIRAAVKAKLGQS